MSFLFVFRKEVRHGAIPLLNIQRGGTIGLADMATVKRAVQPSEYRVRTTDAFIKRRKGQRWLSSQLEKSFRGRENVGSESTRRLLFKSY